MCARYLSHTQSLVFLSFYLSFNKFLFCSLFYNFRFELVFIIIAPAPQPQKRFKRTKSPVNFNICCPINTDIAISRDLLQIKADESEIKRRIASFIGRKREEINNSNVHDFITNEMTDNNDADDMRCARVNSTVHRINGSKGHLKVHRVKNETGPQTMNYKTALDKLMENNNSPIKIKNDPDEPIKPISSGIQERLMNAENHLNLNKNVSTKTVFERLKAIEDRILYLETVSPEYSHFFVSFYLHSMLFSCHSCHFSINFQNKFSQKAEDQPQIIKKELKKTYTADELRELLNNLTNTTT